jgi:hypothetical protein
MDRRELLGVLGAGAMGLTALSRVEAREDEAHAGHHHDEAHADCMKACADCAKACNETASHCLEQLSSRFADFRAMRFANDY